MNRDEIREFAMLVGRGELRDKDVEDAYIKFDMNQDGDLDKNELERLMKEEWSQNGGPDGDRRGPDGDRRGPDGDRRGPGGPHGGPQGMNPGEALR